MVNKGKLFAMEVGKSTQVARNLVKRDVGLMERSVMFG
jgi:hypothetical protein